MLVERAVRNGNIGPTKTGDDRRVDMSQQLHARLERLLHERKAETLSAGWGDMPEWVFCSTTGTAIDQHNLGKAFPLPEKSRTASRTQPLRPTPHVRHAGPGQGKPITYVSAHSVTRIRPPR